jgi:endonuclease/exonuclease/phosphatase family metal-dependent hydrolase
MVCFWARRRRKLMPRAALPPFTLCCAAGMHLVRLDPSRFWRSARCPACRTAVDPLRAVRLVQWLRGNAPRSAVRVGGRRITAGPALAVFSLVLALMVAAMFALLGDRVWVGTILLYTGRWVWLVPIAALGVIVGIADWKWLGVQAAAIWVVLVGVMGLETGWRSLMPKPGGMPIRVATYNVEGGDRVALRMREFVAAHRPDIIALQECREPLRELLPSLLEGYQVDISAGCVASRFPIDTVRAMPQSQFERVGGLLVTTYILRTPSGPVALTNLHLETPRKGLEWLLGSQAGTAPGRIADNILLREIESRLARRWVDSTAVPRLVTGDFNLPADSRIFRISWGDLTNAWSEAGRGFGYTRLAGWIRARIDHVLVDDRFAVTRAAVGADYGSDHLPLIVEVVLRR